MRLLTKGRGRRRARPASPRGLPPPCLCTHSLSFHDRDTGSCHTPVYTGYRDGRAVYEVCYCKGYAVPGRRL